MKRPRLFLSFVTLLLGVLAACGPQVQAPAPPNQAPPQPTNTLAPAQAATPTLEPIDLAGPPMKVGSTYHYVDGSILDAVPNQGPFLMGHGGQDNPEHQVTVSDFWIYSTEVSNQMYAWCVSIGKCSPPDPKDNPHYMDSHFANFPVVGVDWEQAGEYCGFVHGRLPTEAEWEKAASWDQDKQVHRIYPWGDNAPVCDLANFGKCVKDTKAVNEYPDGKSFYGLLNMSGNVYEWVSDWYSPEYYGTSPSQDPKGPDTGTQRSVRSSGFSAAALLTEAAHRFSAQPLDHRNDLGFRCVVLDPTYFAPFCSVSVSYGSSGNTSCPDPSIVHHDACVEKQPKVFVSVQSSPPTNVTVSGLDSCLPGKNDIGVTHECDLGITIRADASCNASPSGSPTCPANYKQDPSDPNSCVSNGGPGACPDGYSYDTTQSCCSAIPGKGASAPLCDVGQHLYNGTCVPDGGPQQPNSVSYTTSSGLDCVPNNPGHCNPDKDPTCNQPCPSGQQLVCTETETGVVCACSRQAIIP